MTNNSKFLKVQKSSTQKEKSKVKDDEEEEKKIDNDVAIIAN